MTRADAPAQLTWINAADWPSLQCAPATIAADVAKGVLTVTVPKTAPAQKKTTEVKAAA